MQFIMFFMNKFRHEIKGLTIVRYEEKEIRKQKKEVSHTLNNKHVFGSTSNTHGQSCFNVNLHGQSQLMW